MRSKTFFILVCVFCIVLGIAFFISRPDKPSRQQTIMGKSFFENLPANDIVSIKIFTGEDSVLLNKGPDYWIVGNRYNYPADFSKITDLVKKLREAKIGRSFQASKKALSRLAIHAPAEKDIPKEQQGTRIVLMDKGGKNLADIILGQTGDASSPDLAFYFRNYKDPAVYLIDQSFKFLDKKPLEWLEKKLIELKAEDIAQVVCYQSKTHQRVYTIKRSEKGKDPVFVDLPEGKKTVKYKLEQVIEVLDNFRIEDVVDPYKQLADSVVAGDFRFEFHLFNGTVYHLYPGAVLNDGSENHYFKVKVSYSPPSEGKEKSKAEGMDKPAAEAENQNQRLSAWTYIISKWLTNSLLTKPDEFFEKEEKK
jgi:hypothetical protein